MLDAINKVAVIGAGTMGQGIAQTVAIAGYQVILYDLNQKLLDSAWKHIEANVAKGVSKGKIVAEDEPGILGKIMLTTTAADLTADMVIEAIAEDLQIKANMFSMLEDLNSKRTIFASNTSSLSITAIGSGLKFPERLAGLHFFNPAHIMKLVEVVRGDSTDPKIVNQITEFAKSIGKIPVQASDSPGFIVNRVARHFYLESLQVLEEGVADCETIDELLESSGFKLGPFKLMDLIGIDINYAVSKSLYQSFNLEPRFKPSKIQKEKVESGQLGRKTGTGFYSYEL